MSFKAPIKYPWNVLAAINKAVEAVGRERILGIVLNRADHASVYHAYDYYGSYGPAASTAAVAEKVT